MIIKAYKASLCKMSILRFIKPNPKRPTKIGLLLLYADVVD